MGDGLRRRLQLRMCYFDPLGILEDGYKRKDLVVSLVRKLDGGCLVEEVMVEDDDEEVRGSCEPHRRRSHQPTN